MTFDTVASFGKPGNDINMGYDLATINNPTMSVFHAVAQDEIRNNFPLSSIKYSDGTLPNNHYEQEFMGAHSDNGGSYPFKKDLSYQALEWMVNNARDIAGAPLKEVPNQYQTSGYFNYDYNNYQNSLNNHKDNPSAANKENLNRQYQIMIDNYTHRSDSDGTWKFWNYSNDNGRDIYYPNDKARP